MRRSKWTGLSFLLPGFCGVAVFSLLPFMDVICSSFVQVVSGRFCGLENYRIVLHNRAFLLAVKNTLRFLLVCLPLLLGISLVLAFLLHAWQMAFHQKQRLLKAAYLVPMAIPAASLVLLWKLMFDKHGFVNGILHLCGIHAVDWMNTGAAFFVLVFSYIWKNLGYDIILWLAALATISPEIYEAARVDGASESQCFFRITMPNLWSSLFLILTLSLINGFKVFREAYLIAGDYPEQHIYLLQHLFNNWFRDLSVNKLAAGAVLMGLVLFVLIMVFQKLFDRTMS